MAVLLPVEQAPPPDVAVPGRADVWRELERLGEEIGRGWMFSPSSGEILSELRR